MCVGITKMLDKINKSCIILLGIKALSLPFVFKGGEKE